MNLVSIIVCTYNQQDTIRRCLDAILSQESKWPFEVIIGEDAGTDGTRAICEDYTNKFPDIVRLMPQAPNKGIVQNYYDCVRAAKGDFIMECAGDDEWCPGRIAICLDIMERNQNIVQILTDVWNREEISGQISVKHSALFPYGLIKGKDVLNGMFHQHHDQVVYYAMTRKSAIMQLMEMYPAFFTGRKYLAEDKQLTTLLGTIGDFYYLNKCTYYYTGDNLSITRTSNYAKKYIYNKNMLMMTHDLADALQYPRNNLKEIYSDIIYDMLTRLFLSGDYVLRQDFRTIANDYNIRPVTFKSYLLTLLTRNRLVWKFSLFLFPKIESGLRLFHFI